MGNWLDTFWGCEGICGYFLVLSTYLMSFISLYPSFVNCSIALGDFVLLFSPLSLITCSSPMIRRSGLFLDPDRACLQPW